MSDTSKDSGRQLLRHALATLAYRGGKVVRDCPAEAATYSAGAATRTPLQILGHVNDILDWALSIGQGGQAWVTSEALDWRQQVERFHTALHAFDAFLATEEPLAVPGERLFQGPIADALTHVGQIALLRRLAGAPVRGENYYKAEVVVGRVGPEQSPPRFEFE